MNSTIDQNPPQTISKTSNKILMSGCTLVTLSLLVISHLATPSSSNHSIFPDHLSKISHLDQTTSTYSLITNNSKLSDVIVKSLYSLLPTGLDYLNSNVNSMMIDRYRIDPLGLESLSLATNSTIGAGSLILFCILLLGIPHGALDHILYQVSWETRQKGKLISNNIHKPNTKMFAINTIKYTTPPSKFRMMSIFYINYLLIMLGWSLAWYVWSEAAFWTFLIVSSYHFGEGDLGYIKGPSRVFRTLLYTSRGALIIGLTLTSQKQITFPIVHFLIGVGEVEFGNICASGRELVVWQHFAMLWMFVFRVIFSFDSSPYTIEEKMKIVEEKRTTGRRPDFPVYGSQVDLACVVYEASRSLLYMALFLILDPLVSFAIYFGVWHSCTCIYNTIIFLKKKGVSGFSQIPEKEKFNHSITLNDVGWFYLLAFPYTLVSVVGMVLVYATFRILDIEVVDYNLVWAVFIGCISVLTGPHMTLILGLYDGNEWSEFGRWIEKLDSLRETIVTI